MWNGQPPTSPISRWRPPSGKRAALAACNWLDFASARMATSWSSKSPCWSTVNRRTEEQFSVLGCLFLGLGWRKACIALLTEWKRSRVRQCVQVHGLPVNAQWSLLMERKLITETFFSGDTRRNTTECQARRARRPQPPNRPRESDRNRRNLQLIARFSALHARNEQTTGACPGRFPACCSGYPRQWGSKPRFFGSPTFRSQEV